MAGFEVITEARLTNVFPDVEMVPGHRARPPVAARGEMIVEHLPLCRIVRFHDKDTRAVLLEIETRQHLELGALDVDRHKIDVAGPLR